MNRLVLTSAALLFACSSQTVFAADFACNSRFKTDYYAPGETPSQTEELFMYAESRRREALCGLFEEVPGIYQAEIMTTYYPFSKGKLEPSKQIDLMVALEPSAKAIEAYDDTLSKNSKSEELAREEAARVMYDEACEAIKRSPQWQDLYDIHMNSGFIVLSVDSLEALKLLPGSVGLTELRESGLTDTYGGYSFAAKLNGCVAHKG